MNDAVCGEDVPTQGTSARTPALIVATEVQEQVREHGDAASQSSIVLIVGTGGRLRYRNRRSKTQGASEDEFYHAEDFYQDKEPEAPKSLYRSKSGKGIAFTKADVDFLVRYISFRR